MSCPNICRLIGIYSHSQVAAALVQVSVDYLLFRFNEWVTGNVIFVHIVLDYLICNKNKG